MRGVLKTLRDRAYDAVYRDGDFALQFIGDIIRGPSIDRNAAFSKRHNKKETSILTDAEHRIFAKMLVREQDENQVTYWKRRKALFNHENKKALIREYHNLEKRQEQIKTKANSRKEQSNLEKQFKSLQNPSNRKGHRQ